MITRRTFSSALAATLLSSPVAVRAQDDSLAGVWTGRAEGAAQEHVPLRVEILQTPSGSLAGTVTGPPRRGSIVSGTFNQTTGATRLQVDVQDESGNVSRFVFDGTFRNGEASGQLTNRDQRMAFRLMRQQLVRSPGGLTLATMDLVFRMAGKPEAVAMARKLNLAAMQVTLGRAADGAPIRLEDTALQAAWVAASREHGIPINSTYLDVLHDDCLKNNDRAQMRVRKGLEITKNLGGDVLMMVFFGKCGVIPRNELDYTIGLCRELAVEAEKMGLILGFENSSSGADNLYAVDKVNSKAFKVWYDVGNSTFAGYDVPAEIRALGKDRICMFHFKDRGYLGEGQVKFPEILSAIKAINFQGYANLETTNPSGNIEADTQRNIAYLKNLMRA